MNLPILDPQVLHQCTDGDLALAQEIYVQFLETSSEDAAHIRVGLQSNDLRAVFEAAHRLKGSSRTVGALAIGACAARLEEAAHADDLVRAKQYLPALIEAHTDLRAELTRLIQTQGSTGS